MARKTKSPARRKRQRLKGLKKIERNLKLGKAGRQEIARPGQIIQPKKGKGAYKRQKFKRGDNL